MPLYRMQSDGRSLRQVARKEFASEQELHALVEENLQELLAIRLIAKEYPIPSGRIDSLGLDESGVPVIIEYKWKSELSAVVQGLFYLDWVLQNKKPFESIVRDKLGRKVTVDWRTQPRLLIIAQDFDVKELAAIKQMGARIELMKYSLYEGLFSYENVNIVESRSSVRKTASEQEPPENSLDGLVSKADPEVGDLFMDLRSRILAISDAVWESVHSYYCDYRTVSTFASVNLQKKQLKILIKMGEAELDDPEGVCKPIPKSWGYGLLNKEFRVSLPEETDYAMSLIKQAHDHVSG